MLRAARQLGHEVTVVAVEGEASAEIDRLAGELGGATVTWVDLGQLGKCLATFLAAGVTRAVMAGQVKHVKLFGGVMPDPTLLAVLARLGSQNTDSLIAAVAGVLEAKGITLMDSTALLSDLLARPGVLTEAQADRRPCRRTSSSATASPTRWPASTSARRSSSRTAPWWRLRRWKGPTRRSAARAGSRAPARAS